MIYPKFKLWGEFIFETIIWTLMHAENADFCF